MNDKHIAALGMRRLGSTFKEIGEHLGVSSGRARQIYLGAARHERMGKQAHKWTHGLTTKTANVLINAGFTDKNEVIAAIKSGKLGLNPITTKGKLYGIGPHTISEVSLWAGADSALLPSVQAAIALLVTHGYTVTKPNTSTKQGI